MKRILTTVMNVAIMLFVVYFYTCYVCGANINPHKCQEENFASMDKYLMLDFD